MESNKVSFRGSDDEQGVYNHLLFFRCLGSITILRRWARIPRIGNWGYFTPTKWSYGPLLMTGDGGPHWKYRPSELTQRTTTTLPLKTSGWKPTHVLFWRQFRKICQMEVEHKSPLIKQKQLHQDGSDPPTTHCNKATKIKGAPNLHV